MLHCLDAGRNARAEQNRGLKSTVIYRGFRRGMTTLALAPDADSPKNLRFYQGGQYRSRERHRDLPWFCGVQSRMW